MITPDELEKIKNYQWLTLRERRVFEMFYHDGIHIEDIAAELDVNRSTVSRILKAIRNKSVASGVTIQEESG